MDANGDSRPKRKHSSSPYVARPNKHIKDDQFGSYDEVGDEEIELLMEGDLLMDRSPLDARLAPPALVNDSVEWQRTIETVVKNVVSIRFSQTCAFDAEAALTSEATGFVVDKERGYILTNRHVVGAGPFWGYCVFDNHEEVCFTYLPCTYRMDGLFLL